MAPIDYEFKENLLPAIWESEAAEEQMTSKMEGWRPSLDQPRRDVGCNTGW
jgi:hypothetical protein